MADLDYDHFDGGYMAAGGQSRFGRIANLGGAVLSIGLIVGGGLWAYKLAIRDVSGIPVIRALGGPLRLSPETPGGQEAMHQGLSVNAIAAAGTALPLPETLTLAPRTTALRDEDVAGIIPLDPVETAVVAEAADMISLEAAALPEALPETQADAVALALAEALGQEMPADQTALAASEESTIPRPKPRPGSVLSDVANIDPAFAPSKEIDPADIETGARLVQLGAFDDQDAARAEWVRLVGSFGDLMAGKALVVQPATSGGRTFFRLRAHGFADEDDARRFCTAILVDNPTCIPVAQR